MTHRANPRNPTTDADHLADQVTTLILPFLLHHTGKRHAPRQNLMTGSNWIYGGGAAYPQIMNQLLATRRWPSQPYPYWNPDQRGLTRAYQPSTYSAGGFGMLDPGTMTDANWRKFQNDHMYHGLLGSGQRGRGHRGRSYGSGYGPGFNAGGFGSGGGLYGGSRGFPGGYVGGGGSPLGGGGCSSGGGYYPGGPGGGSFYPSGGGGGYPPYGGGACGGGSGGYPHPGSYGGGGGGGGMLSRPVRSIPSRSPYGRRAIMPPPRRRYPPLHVQRGPVRPYGGYQYMGSRWGDEFDGEEDDECDDFEDYYGDDGSSAYDDGLFWPFREGSLGPL